jgi:hypothetical protein
MKVKHIKRKHGSWAERKNDSRGETAGSREQKYNLYRVQSNR